MWRLVTVCLVCLLAIGCEDPTTGLIKGSVTVDGNLPDTGYIGFTATDGQTGPVGSEIIEGKYSVIAPLGEAKVEIRIPKVVGKQKLYNTPDSPIQEITEEALPPRYNDETELTHLVEMGEQTRDFDLTTKRKK